MMSDPSGSEQFYAMHRQGFVRVATCTPRVRPADVGFNRDAILEEARRADAARVDLAVFPELCVSSYAIDDLLQQDALLDAVEAALARDRGRQRRAGAGPAGRARRCAATGGSTTARSPSRRGTHPRRGAEVVPAELPRILREALVRARPRHRRARRSTLAGASVPFGVGPRLRGGRPRRTSSSTWRSARTSGRPTPPSTRRRRSPAPSSSCNLSASNIVIGKADDRAPALRARSRRAAGAAYVYSAAGPGESTTDLAWDGQAAIYELGDLLAETERFPTEPAIWRRRHRRRAHALGERMRTQTFNDAAEAAGHPERPFRRVAFEHRPTLRGHRPHPPDRPLPLRARRPRRASTRTATRPSTSRCRGCASASRSTQRRAHGHRRLRRARLDPRADRRGQGLRPRSACRAPTSSASPCRASRPARAPSPTPGS